MKGKKNFKRLKKASKKPSPKILSDKKSQLRIREFNEQNFRMLAEKLEAEKETAQLYLDIAGVMLVVIGSDQKVKLANKKTCQTLGYTEKQILGSNWFDNFIPEHSRKKVAEVFNKLIAGEIKPAEYFENPVLTKSGEEKLIAWHNTILRDKKGTITGTLSSGSDITELKKIEESLIHSEEKYRSFFTSVPVGWAYCKVVLDNKNKPEDYIFLEVNNAFEKLTGLKKENILDKKATKVIPQIKKTHWIEKFGNVAITGKPVKGETYLEPFNKWYSIYVSCPQKGYFITVLEDINSRKKFEEALLKSEEKYRILSENIPVVVYSALPDKYSTNTFLSGRSKELTGYAPEEFINDPKLWDRIIFDEDKPQVWKAVEKHRAKKTILHVEYRIICKNGSVKWLKDMATPILDEQGKLIRIDGFMEDITERKQAEEALEISETRYRRLFEAAKDGTLILDADSGQIMDVNPYLIEMLGYSHEEFLGKKLWEIGAFKDIAESQAHFKKLQTEGYIRYEHLPLHTANGQTVDVEFVSNTYQVNHNAVIQCNIRNITERHQVENIMQARLRLLEFAASHSTDEFLTATLDEIETLTGSTIGFYHFVAPDQKTLSLQNWSTNTLKNMCTAEGKSSHYDIAQAGVWTDCVYKRRPVIHNDYASLPHRKGMPQGHASVIREVVAPIFRGKQIRAVIGVGNKSTDYTESDVEIISQVGDLSWDITERKQAEERLNIASKKLENIIEFLPDATVIVGADKKIIAWNRAMEEMTGVQKKEMIGKDHIHVATPFYGKPRKYLIDLLYMDEAEIVSKYSFVMKKGDAFYAEAFTPALFNGKGAYIWAVAAPLYDTNGNMIGAIESIRDITDRRQAEEKLQKSEKQLQIIFDTSHAGIIQIDPQGKIILANERTAQILGYSTEKLIGSKYIDHIHPSHKEQAKKMLLGLISGSVDNIDTELLYIRENGAEFWGHIAARRITEHDNKLTGIVVIISDITKHKMLEEELLHAQKMEAVGQLAGGVAHDFNNILNAIIGFGSLLQMKMKDDDPLKQHVEQILGSADRAAELTHNLLAFSRKETINLKTVELNEIIAHVEKFLKRIIAENIEFTTKKSKEKLNILADTGHIEQVIINLATNARDAMPDGGQLVISSESIEIDRNYIEMHGYGEPGHYAVISVTDTGTGMSKEIQEKIFDPFFTTKEVNKGTGLGLAMTYGIVKQHKGFINVYSEVGKGTCFKIYLPLTQFGKIEESAPLAYKSLIGTETVLMAEDDIYLRKLSEVVLEEFGYKMISAENGEEAVRKFAENKDKVDICVFDVIMPKKSGAEAFEEIKNIKSDAKILFISGYTSDFISKDRLPEKEFAFLPKPFKPEVLLMKIREILDK